MQLLFLFPSAQPQIGALTGSSNTLKILTKKLDDETKVGLDKLNRKFKNSARNARNIRSKSSIGYGNASSCSNANALASNLATNEIAETNQQNVIDLFQTCLNQNQ